jgi:heme exporter protein D
MRNRYQRGLLEGVIRQRAREMRTNQASVSFATETSWAGP